MKFNSSKYNNHWQDKVLSELGHFQRGKSRHRPRNDKALFEGGRHPLVQTGEIKEANLYIKKHSATYNDFGLAQSKLWPAETLCITIAANIAETSLIDYPMCFPDSVVGFNAFPEESSELFMHYVFTYIRRAIQKSATGSIQDNINIGYLTKLQFKIPIKPYQDKIATILSTLDAKIDLNNRINVELESMAKTLYDYWFVQFDFPISKEQAKAMSKPRLEGKPYKSSGGKMVYNSTLKREIPEGWGAGELQSILGVVPRAIKVSNRDYKMTGGIPVIDQSVREIAGYTDIMNSCLKGELNCVVFGDHTRILKFINFDFARGADGTQILLSNDKKMPQHLLYQTLGTIDLSNYGYARHFKFLKKTPIILPDTVCSKMYEDISSDIYIKYRQNTFEAIELTQLRDYLLPMLMNGQVTVS